MKVYWFDKVPQRVHFIPGRFMYIYNDSNSISGTIAPGENLFKLCVKKQAVFGRAESWKKIINAWFQKGIQFLNCRCEKGCKSTSIWTIIKVWNIKWYTLLHWNQQIGVKCLKRGAVASTRIVRVVLALNILKNGLLLQVIDTQINDVHDVLTFCDFTQSYCKLLMRASAWITKGNTVKTKANVYNMPQRDIIFRTTKNAHI